MGFVFSVVYLANWFFKMAVTSAALAHVFDQSRYTYITQVSLLCWENRKVIQNSYLSTTLVASSCGVETKKGGFLEQWTSSSSLITPGDALNLWQSCYFASLFCINGTNTEWGDGVVLPLSPTWSHSEVIKIRHLDSDLQCQRLTQKAISKCWHDTQPVAIIV